ncbi:ran-binding protein 3-like [Tiliqua scincoides]|uniref:ran-binding protein 3-like n=1 Tax=Tiliqua scincoides TaxID=71010 RepID=UPI003461913B
MRTQQIPPSTVNTLCSGITASCAGSGCHLTIRSEHQMKNRPHFTKRQESRDTWAMNPAANTRANVYLFHSSGNNKYKDGFCADKSVIAEPIFVFKKKERPGKRPAEDPGHKTENVFIGFSRKRARSSSFPSQISDSQSYRETVLTQKRARSSSLTVLPRFPPSQTVKKNNIFMTATLLQKSMDLKTTEKGPSSEYVQKEVLRPAILQPPQTPLCRQVKKAGVENVLEDKYEAKTEVSEDPHSLTVSSEKLPFFLSSLDSKAVSKQLPEGRPFSISRHSDFVFGENIVERVLRAEKISEVYSESKPNSVKESTFTGDFHSSSSLAAPVFAKNTTLVESAAAYTSHKPTERCLLGKVEVTTGEEAEHNVLQIHCCLFLFNKASLSWIERGNGSLRLNDTSSSQCGMLQSRLVMRNRGSMRLILNTRLWAQMVIERANRKSLCITATDLEDCSVKVFLIQASSKDTGSLYAAIHHRLIALRNFTEQECATSQMEPETDAQPPSCDSDDEENEKMAHVSNRRSASQQDVPDTTAQSIHVWQLAGKMSDNEVERQSTALESVYMAMEVEIATAKTVTIT